MNKSDIESIVDAALASRGAFLVELKVSADNRIAVFADLIEGHISIDSLKMISREIETALDPENNDFELEVSSPGMFNPFKVRKQYEKSVGRDVKVKLQNGEVLKAKLIGLDDEGLELETTKRVPKPVGKGKVTVTETEKVAWTNVLETTLEFTF